MSTDFEKFVNSELPKRLFIGVPETGDLPGGKMVITKGVGLECVLSDISPTDSIDFATRELIVDENLVINKTLTLYNTPITSSVVIYQNGLIMNQSDYSVNVNIVTFSINSELVVGDKLKITYSYVIEPVDPFQPTAYSLNEFVVTEELVNTKLITLDQTPITATFNVFLNGLCLYLDSYVLLGNVVSFNETTGLVVNDTMKISYTYKL